MFTKNYIKYSKVSPFMKPKLTNHPQILQFLPPLDDCQEDRKEDGRRPYQVTRSNTEMEDDDDIKIFMSGLCSLL
jgi:hypothetical protein